MQNAAGNVRTLHFLVTSPIRPFQVYVIVHMETVLQNWKIMKLIWSMKLNGKTNFRFPDEQFPEKTGSF